MKAEPLDQQLAKLSKMSSIELRAEWRRVWKEPAPPLGHDLLRRGVGWKMQARVHGGLMPAVSRDLDRLVRQLERGGDITPERTARPGTRLVRQWRDRTYSVMVLDEGFLFEDRHYASLTQIAFAITGVKWSGPRFFGLAVRATHANSKGGADGTPTTAAL